MSRSERGDDVVGIEQKFCRCPSHSAAAGVPPSCKEPHHGIRNCDRPNDIACHCSSITRHERADKRAKKPADQCKDAENNCSLHKFLITANNPLREIDFGLTATGFDQGGRGRRNKNSTVLMQPTTTPNTKRNVTERTQNAACFLLRTLRFDDRRLCAS